MNEWRLFSALYFARACSGEFNSRTPPRLFFSAISSLSLPFFCPFLIFAPSPRPSLPFVQFLSSPQCRLTSQTPFVTASWRGLSSPPRTSPLSPPSGPTPPNPMLSYSCVLSQPPRSCPSSPPHPFPLLRREVAPHAAQQPRRSMLIGRPSQPMGEWRRILRALPPVRLRTVRLLRSSCKVCEKSVRDRKRKRERDCVFVLVERVCVCMCVC